MGILCYHLTLEGPLGTPVRSNTLFGHLCWALRHRDGEGALTDWLADFDAAPLRLSDAFPVGVLPRPLVRPLAPGELDRWLERHGGDELEALSRLKRFRKRRWIAVDDFLALRHEYREDRLYDRWVETPETAGSDAGARTERVAHNQIDRWTGRTPETGGLYFQHDTWYAGDGPHLWVFADPGALGADRLTELMTLVGRVGYGRDASTGRGRFRVEPAEPPAGLFEGAGNRWMTLSRGVLTPGMGEPRYRLATHYGRLGADRATGQPSPFKRPILLVEPGSTFSGDEGPHGALLDGVHPSVADVRENAYHLCVPFTEAMS
ncbi:type III-A CRISPR-associated RAMP protein Csm4 [Deferrisoma camini]|uniref:type III-A CRISPR-associated RAMP protein Csm4 n=1 Tax=Deferrisoma camini TaxID=1035120 RepID=UPI00046D198E|nr:hypothetical protein [Deferrisoma camini]